MFQQYLQQQLLTEVSYKLNAKTVHCKIFRIVLIKLIINNSGKACTIICENAFNTGYSYSCIKSKNITIVTKMYLFHKGTRDGTLQVFF